MKTVKELLDAMTLPEKAALLTGADTWHVKNCPRLGLAETMVSDGPHGLRKQEEKADNLGLNGSISAVCFPSAAGLASSFNRDLLHSLGETLGEECLAENVSILLGPAINIKRSPLCGRNFEYFSEDPYLAGELAASYVTGLQGKGVGASVKHFAANNQEYRRATISTVADERTLRELYLSAFETVVRKSQPYTVMCAYNRINGVHCSENRWLLNDVLRDDWGFEGYVMTDWGAAVDRVKGVAAGCDLEMPSSGMRNTKRLLEAVRQGKLSEEDIDRAAGRILSVSLRSSERPSKPGTFDREKDHAAAKQVALESMVLLKNEGALLPLNPEKKIAFLGAFARHPRYQGGGSSHVNAARVTDTLAAARSITDVLYAPGYSLDSPEPDSALLKKAVAVAKEADTAVVFVGLTDDAESEGYDRSHLSLSPAHDALVQAVAAVQPNTVVVLHNGSPVTMPWIDSVPAVLEAYLGGEACGEAIADLLFGNASPSGKLAETFPLSLEDVPCARYFPGKGLTAEYREGLYVGYRYYDTVEKEVLFPFGHGLSYTQFSYSGLRLSTDTLEDGNSLTVAFTLKNIGERGGAEAAQLYLAAPRDTVFRPVQELKGFEKAFLKPGETREITLTLPPRAFQYFHPTLKTWCTSPGTYQIRIGSSSRDIRLTGEIHVTAEEPEAPAYEAGSLPSYATGAVGNVSDEEFQQLLGHPLPKSRREPGERFTLESSLEDAKDTVWGRRIAGLLRKAAGGNYAFFVDAVISSPIRSFILSESDAHAHAIVSLLNKEHTLRSLAILVKWMLRLKKRTS